MTESREKVQQRVPRSISTMRSNRVMSAAPASFKRYSTSADEALAARSAEGNGCTVSDEVARLQDALQESEERIGVLETLLREKELLQRHDSSLEVRLGAYEEQLNHIATFLKKECTSQRKDLPGRRDEKICAAASKMDASGTRGLPSAECVIEGVQQLHCEKKRLEGELHRKDRLIAALRAELLADASNKNSDNGVVACELPIPTSSDSWKTPEAQTHRDRGAAGARIDALEQRLIQLQGRYTRTEARLAESQKECQRAKQSLRAKEKELHACQRTCREIAEKAPAIPTDEEEMTSTQHRQYFKGVHWPQLMLEKPHALRTAFLKDVSLALRVPYGHIAIIEMLPGPSLITIEMNVQHSASQRFEDIEAKLNAHKYTAMEHLLAHRDDPRDGWDMVDQQLHEVLKALAERDEEVNNLRCRLKCAESSLDRRDDERENDDALVTRVLDETERTVREVHDELERQRAAARAAKDMEEKMQRQLDEALAAKDAEVALQLRDADNKRNEEVAAARRQVTERNREMLRQAEEVRATQVINVSISLVWDTEAETAVPFALDDGAADILRVLLIGEASVACRCATLRVASMECDARELRAELQVLAAPSAVVQAEEAVRQCRMTSVRHFLRELREAAARAAGQCGEIQRLARELKDSGAKVELLQKENARDTAAVQTRLQQLEQREKEAEAKVEKANTRAQEAMAECEEAKAESKKAMDQLLVSRAENQRVKLEARTAKTQAEHATAAIQSLTAQLEASRAETLKAQAELHTVMKECEKKKTEAMEQAQAALAEARSVKEEARQVKAAAMTESERQRDGGWVRLCAVESECDTLRTEILRLTARLADARADLERATDALEAARTEHNQLKAESAVWAASHERFTVHSRRVAELLATRRETKKLRENATDTTEDLCIVALKTVFAAHDALQVDHDKSSRQWRATELSLREKLTTREHDCTELSSQVERLRVALAESQSSSAAQAKVNARLNREIATHREQADIIVKTLIREEDARRELDREVTVLRAKLAQCESDQGLSAHAEEMQRLREFCTRTLRLPLTESHRTLGEILSAMELHGNASLESLSAAAVSVNGALRLLKQCVAAPDEHKAIGGSGSDRLSRNASPILSKNGRQQQQQPLTPPAVSGRAFNRSVSCGSRASPLLSSIKGAGARPVVSQTRTGQTPIRTRSTDSQFARSAKGSHTRTATPPPSVGAAAAARAITRANPKNGTATGNETLGAALCPREGIGSAGGVDNNALSSSLASSAAEVLYYTNLLQSTVEYWRVNERRLTTQNRELLEKRDAALSGSAPPVPIESGDKDFVYRSRAHAQRVLLSVTDHLRDALVAFGTDGSRTDLRMAEESITFAAKRIVQSVASIFSPEEIHETGGKRVEDCFTELQAQITGRTSRSPRVVPPGERSPNVPPMCVNAMEDERSVVAVVAGAERGAQRVGRGHTGRHAGGGLHKPYGPARPGAHLTGAQGSPPT